MNLLQKLLASAKIGDGLDFGILENVVLKSVTNEVQIRDEQEVQRNCYMRFQRINAKGEAYQESQFSYFNIDPEREKKPSERLLSQLQQLTEIAFALDPKCGEDFGTKSFKHIQSEENFINEARGKNVAVFQNKLSDIFVKCVAKYIDKKPMLRLKVVTSWDGKYMNLPDAGSTVESMSISAKDSALGISHLERQNHAKVANVTATSGSNQEVKPESNGKAPKKNAVLAEL